MAKRLQVIIDLEGKEIKGTNKKLRDELEILMA